MTECLLNIGDRVEYTGSRGKRGRLGTIVSVANGMYTVAWDNSSAGVDWDTINPVILPNELRYDPERWDYEGNHSHDD
jgi:hypothetical protein